MNNELTIFLIFIGIFAVGGFCQTNSKGFSSGKIGRFFGFLPIPATVSLLWKSSELIGWWTILLFILTCLLQGTIVAIYINYARRQGNVYPDNPASYMAIISQLQPIQGLIFTLSSIGCWFIP